MEIVKFSHFLLDVINVLSILLHITVDHNSSIADIFATMQSTVGTLQMYQARSDISNNEIIILKYSRRVLYIVLYFVSFRAGPMERLMKAIQHFHGHQLVENGNISAVRTKVPSNVVKRLSDCFCDANQGVLKATLIGSFNLWPDKMKQGIEL